jgi:predicted nucleic acid-binding protein
MPVESSLQFIDTNILVYAYDLSAGEKQRAAKKLIERMWIEHSGCLSVQVLQEFYVSVTRKVARPLEAEMVAGIILDLARWKVYVPDAGDVLAAISIQQKYHLSFWDAMIIQTAIAAGCQVIWSEDLSENQIYEGARIRNPFTG